MTNTYTQLYIHLVFAVQGRQQLIAETVRERLQQYLCGILRDRQHKALSIYCMPDHTHLLVDLHPDQSVAELVQLVKSNSTKWLNENRLLPGRFEWQRGYGAFSYAKSQLDSVINYILTQPEHHRKFSFREEYLDILKRFEIEYDPRYLFSWSEEK
ncbi:IS200/IS605 family transposase [Hymenobacter sp. BT664]|uniref:IS200/IS605 family transposase n=1 Tax=Hymenobacter montanus TaxID=2771359 RepID=A0A927BGF7_9BACT|nr:IS200/IS605 family transposase [Hymenobacter montanus]MBD2770422.1 IS200/IS605 family transposase [Hymenobacter montanus]